jgi:hypothetical protein
MTVVKFIGIAFAVLVYIVSVLITVGHAKILNRSTRLWLLIGGVLPIISIVWVFKLQTKKVFKSVN